MYFPQIDIINLRLVYHKKIVISIVFLKNFSNKIFVFLGTSTPASFAIS